MHAPLELLRSVRVLIWIHLRGDPLRLVDAVLGLQASANMEGVCTVALTGIPLSEMIPIPEMVPEMMPVVTAEIFTCGAPCSPSRCAGYGYSTWMDGRSISVPDSCKLATVGRGWLSVPWRGVRLGSRSLSLSLTRPVVSVVCALLVPC